MTLYCRWINNSEGFTYLSPSNHYDCNDKFEGVCISIALRSYMEKLIREWWRWGAGNAYRSPGCNLNQRPAGLWRCDVAAVLATSYSTVSGLPLPGERRKKLPSDLCAFLACCPAPPPSYPALIPRWSYKTFSWGRHRYQYLKIWESKYLPNECSFHNKLTQSVGLQHLSGLI